jgi:hypothetical protein
MNGSKFARVLIGGVFSLLLVVSAADAQVYDLAGDWSDVSNPNGPWALYKAPGQLFATNQADWNSNGTNQPAWADEPYPQLAHVPMWAKAIGDVGALLDPLYTGFVDAGTVYMHSAETGRTGTEFSSVIWTSPSDGMIEIDGGAWVAKAHNRPQRWVLLKNGAVLTLGDLTQGDPYTKTNPFLFSAGSGGPSAVMLDVLQGDQLELLIHRVGPVPGTFVGVDLSITLTIPEPATVLLGLTWSLLVVSARRRRAL